MANVKFGTTSADTINGDDLVGDFDDIIFGDIGDDIIGGLTGNDILYGQAGNDILNGGLGNDVLDGGTDATGDSMYGGAGNDVYFVDSASDVVDETSDGAGAGTTDAGGIDTVVSTLASYTLPSSSLGKIENLILGTGASVITGIGNDLANRIVGNALNNILTSGAGTLGDKLIGGAGVDTLTGGGGNDTLDGGIGADSLAGGAGNDLYLFDNIGDRITSDTSGIDTLQITAADNTTAFVVAAGIENVVLMGATAISANASAATAAVKMTGNSGANTLTGGSGNDSLSGGGANDSLAGGIGNDTLNGGAGADSLNGGAGNDTYYFDDVGDRITADASGADSVIITAADNVTAFVVAAGIEKITLAGSTAISATASSATAAVTMTGNSGNNTLTGGDGNDSLLGNAGADTLNGGNGADTLNGGTGNDSMVGGNGKDTYIVDSTADVISETNNSTSSSQLDTVQAGFASGTYVLSDNVENITLTGSTAISATGNASKNLMTGNSNSNTLTGNDGDDTLLGLGGADILSGGNGDDVITGGAGGDTVTVHGDIVGDQNTIKFAAGVTDTVATASSITGIDLYSDLILNSDSGDFIDLTVAVANVGTAVDVATAASVGTFISDMNTALHVGGGAGFDTETVSDIAAAVVSFSDRDFLAVDLNKDGSFTASDFVIEITGSTFTSLTTDTFV